MNRDEAARTLRAVASRPRLQLLALIKESGDTRTMALAEALEPLSQATVSHHLRELRWAGLISKDGGRDAWQFVPGPLADLATFLRELS